ncbi:MAG: GatB/YqeY domain-containing protein [Geminicoccaceae bacterium]
MLIDRIREDRLHAMKARDEMRKNLLGTLYAAATKDDKQPDDAAVVRTVRSFVKSLDETVTLVESRGGNAASQRAELAILADYLPRSLSERELLASIQSIVAALPERSPRAMGQVMAALKQRHGDALDSRAASALVRSALTEL